MNKRSFLKATGVTFVASLFAAPFLGRRDSEANAQESDDLAVRIEELRKEFREQLQNEIDERNAADAAIKRSLDVSFIGTVTAIASNKIPYGWHLCDGTPIPDTSEYKLLKDLTGLSHFPDYRGVFLRGLDEKTQDGKGYSTGRDPDADRIVNTIQQQGTMAHTHPCTSVDNVRTSIEGHDHGNINTPQGVGGVKKCNQLGPGHRDHSSEDNDDNWGPDGQEFDNLCVFPITGGAHSHAVPNHSHTVKAQTDGNVNPAETRPVNVSVRYIIKYM